MLKRTAHFSSLLEEEQLQTDVSTASYNRPTKEKQHWKPKLHTLFTTLKFNRFIPANLQQDRLTLLTHVLLSDLLTGQTVHQLVTPRLHLHCVIHTKSTAQTVLPMTDLCVQVRPQRETHPTSLTLCVTAQVRKTRDMTWNPVRTTEDGTIPGIRDKRQTLKRMTKYRESLHTLTDRKWIVYLVHLGLSNKTSDPLTPASQTWGFAAFQPGFQPMTWASVL